MFCNLRQGSQVYILLKPSTLEIGTVTNILSPILYYMPNLTIDIKVDIDGKSTEFKQLPANLGITYYDNGKTIISDSKESVSSEVQNMIKQSNDVIDSIPYHKEVIEKGEELLKLLNPQFAQLKEQELKITNLETKVGSMENKLDNITNMLNKALNNDNSSKGML